MAETGEAILAAAEKLFATEPFDRVSLAAIAREAGVTIPTLQRRFGNKEGVFAACVPRVRGRVEAQRGSPPVDDIRACIRELVAHYELEGPMMWHLLRQEADVPFLRAVLEEGRAVHRAWVETVFSCAPGGSSALGRDRRSTRVDALVAATDLYVWKLLRLDLGRSRAATEATMIATVEAIATDMPRGT